MKTVVLATLISVVLGACTSTIAHNELPSVPDAQATPVSELDVDRVAARPGDLPSFKVLHRKTGIAFNVYHDAASTNVAEASIPLLVSFCREVAALTGTNAGAPLWHAVVFARDAEKLVLHRDKAEVRWSVDVADDGSLSDRGLRDFYVVVPHEQVHAVAGHDPGGMPAGIWKDMQSGQDCRLPNAGIRSWQAESALVMLWPSNLQHNLWRLVNGAG